MKFIKLANSNVILNLDEIIMIIISGKRETIEEINVWTAIGRPLTIYDQDDINTLLIHINQCNDKGEN